MEYLILGLNDISEVCPASAGGGCICNGGSNYCSGTLCIQYCGSQCTSNCITLCISKTSPCGFVCPGNVVPIPNASGLTE